MKKLFLLFAVVLLFVFCVDINAYAAESNNFNVSKTPEEISAEATAILNSGIELTEDQINTLKKLQGKVKPVSAFCKEQIEILENVVEVSIEAQHLWYYKDKQLLFECDVTTGRNGHGTDKGITKIKNKARNATLRGADYVSFVKYWMGFNDGGEGFHDASWRKKFGTDTWRKDGSHGCVNMPEEYAVMLYNNVEVGCMVYVY